MNALMRRRAMMMDQQVVDDNLIDMDKYHEETSETFAQTFSVDTTQSYYLYGERYAVCYSKWESNLGMGDKDSDGKFIFPEGTVKIKVYFYTGGNPYFGFTKRS